MVRLTFLFVLLITSCSMKNNNSNNLREQAVHTLNTVLLDGQRWEKVHAAEFLIASGYDENVEDVFRSELNQYGNIPEYRIGIWRVLYRSAKISEKQQWSDSILQVFEDASSPDRIHAVETLAKLKIIEKESDSACIRSALQSGDLRLWFYTQWWHIPQSPNGANEMKKFLFSILQSDIYDLAIKQLAAYVIREDKTLRLDDEELTTLKNLGFAKPDDSNDLKKLVELLNSPENDTKSAAAFAILQITNK